MELVLTKLELSSGDFDRNDIRSKPQLSRVESTLLPLISKSVTDCVCGDNCMPTGFGWIFLFGGSGGGLLALQNEIRLQC